VQKQIAAILSSGLRTDKTLPEVAREMIEALAADKEAIDLASQCRAGDETELSAIAVVTAALQSARREGERDRLRHLLEYALATPLLEAAKGVILNYCFLVDRPFAQQVAVEYARAAKGDARHG
jgi:hypothetical protein